MKRYTQLLILSCVLPLLAIGVSVASNRGEKVHVTHFDVLKTALEKKDVEGIRALIDESLVTRKLVKQVWSWALRKAEWDVSSSDRTLVFTQALSRVLPLFQELSLHLVSEVVGQEYLNEQVEDAVKSMDKERVRDLLELGAQLSQSTREFLKQTLSTSDEGDKKMLAVAKAVKDYDMRVLGREKMVAFAEEAELARISRSGRHIRRGGKVTVKKVDDTSADESKSGRSQHRSSEYTNSEEASLLHAGTQGMSSNSMTKGTVNDGSNIWYYASVAGLGVVATIVSYFIWKKRRTSDTCHEQDQSSAQRSPR